MKGSPRNGSRKSPPPRTAEHRANHSAALMGHVVSVETRAKIAAANKGAIRSPEQRAKIAASLVGRKRQPFTDETRARMSAASRGKPKSAAHRINLGLARCGGKQRPETIEKRATSLRGKHRTPEQRVRIRAGVALAIAEGRWKMPPRAHTSDTRARISAGRIRGFEEGRIELKREVRYTKLAQKLHQHLRSQGFMLEPEVRFGRFTVDLYDRANHTAYEADGSYWHRKAEARKPGASSARDEYLRTRCGLSVRHFTDTEIAAMGSVRNYSV